MSDPTPPSWLNRQQPQATWPDWLKAHAVDAPQPNGSFTIKSKLGQARVHLVAIVFEWKGVAYTCAPKEAGALLAELRAEDAAPPPPRRGEHGRSLEADEADRRDDTDDITRKLRCDETSPRPIPVPANEWGTRPVGRGTVSQAAPGEPGGAARLEPPATPVTLSSTPKAARGSMPSIEWIQLDRLMVDDSYQRSVDTGPSRALMKRIGEEWDWRLCVPLMVSRRVDGLYVIDGQHRLYGARLRTDVPQLPCCISAYDGPADEAAMFVAANRERRAMNRLDDFHAAQASGNPEALAVAKLIADVGFFVSRRTGSAAWKPGEVAFTAAITKALRRQGEVVTSDALRLMAEAFPDQRLIVGSSVFTAIIAVLADQPAGYERDTLLRALRTFDMAGWSTFISSSRGGSTRNKQLKDMLLEAYADAAKADPGVDA